MNTSQFMDKQIMDLTTSHIGTSPNKDKDKDFIDLMNNPQHHEDHDVNNGVAIGIKKEEIVPSYDFQPIRGGLSQSFNFDSASTARVWNSADNESKSLFRNYNSIDTVEPAKFVLEKDCNTSDATIVSEIDRTMKKYVDNMLQVLESVSARITQLETRTHNLENSIDDLKLSLGKNHGITDGKMRLMENILREVQSGVLLLKDKQEMVEAQLQLSKLQVSKVDQQQLESQSSGYVDTVQQAASAPLQSHLLPPPPPITFPQSVPALPPTVVPPLPATQQNLQPPVQLPSQFPPSHVPSVPQRETYFPSPGQTQDAPNQHYQVPPPQPQHHPPAAPPHQPYQPPPQPQYSQPPHPPQLQSSLGHLSEDAAYNPPQNYAPNLHPPPSQPASSPPSQQYYGTPPPPPPPPSHMYEPPSSRSSSGFPAGYGPQSGPSEPYPYGGPPSQYGSGSTMKQQLPAATAQSGGSGYPHLPTARVLPQALPTASGVGGGSAYPGSGNRVPVDDVVDKVTSMGFPRDHVRATVHKLTENGQSVDLNMVLDKLMNDGEVQPQRGWFGR
ncbi:myosin tail region-interacting protein MTI1-like [Mangifera indica]|uniref:myosin tail region-interacting protein MTI1-like n=1 Tax=Mangifera indica TaxID=29780 RepID=UPI001CFB46EA|nr:myosin tail region-interacting protein MTI1-like [Mangifera indica]